MTHPELANTLDGPSISEAEFEDLYWSVSNWGRWGDDDQHGCLNFVTDEIVRSAAALVVDGRAISLQLPLDEHGPQTGAFGRINPVHHMALSGADHVAGVEPSPLGIGYADDALFLFLQGGSQWDALAHIFRDGKMYNGFDAREVSSRGAAALGIEQIPTLVTRGVLLDLPAVLDGYLLEPGDAVHPALLDRACARLGVTVGEGDIVLVRTGDMARRRSSPGWDGFALGDAPGLSLRSVPWLHERQVAGVVTDTWGVEVRPNEVAESFQPGHLAMIASMGLLLGEIWDLDALAADCAADGRYEFMLVAPPLRITGAVGSPVNAQAIK